MDDQTDSNAVLGYIHQVSPGKTEPPKKYLDFHLQTGTDTLVRGACFPSKKRELFTEKEQNSKPVKIPA